MVLLVSATAAATLYTINSRIIFNEDDDRLVSIGSNNIICSNRVYAHQQSTFTPTLTTTTTAAVMRNYLNGKSLDKVVDGIIRRNGLTLTIIMESVSNVVGIIKNA